MTAARRLQSLDPRLARETYLDALSTALLAGRLAPSGAAVAIAEAALAAPPAENPPRPSDLLLDGVATPVTAGFSPGAPVLKRALASYGSGDWSGEEELRWIPRSD